MKRIILTVAAILAFGFANAQEKEKEIYGVKKGDMWVEGALSVSSSNNSSDPAAKANDYSFTPKMGFMHDDKFGFGGFLDFAGTKFNNNDKNSAWGIGV